MFPEWFSPLVAKAKVAGLLGAALAAGGLGGTFALTHVAPVAHQTVQQTAASADPESSEASDPETTGATDPQTSASPDPESTDAQDPETGQAQDPSTCPDGVRNHGAYVSSVAHSAARGKDGDHGTAVSAAAKSDCGKKTKHSTGPDSSDSESGDAQSHGAQSRAAHSGDAQPGKGDSHSQSGTGGKSGASHSPAAVEHGQGHGKH